jgi:hypothetical protein
LAIVALLPFLGLLGFASKFGRSAPGSLGPYLKHPILLTRAEARYVPAVDEHQSPLLFSLRNAEI